MSRMVSDANENLLRVNIDKFFTDLEHEIQEALFTYWNDNLTNGQLNLILAPIHEKHREYYNLLMRHKIDEYQRSQRIGTLLTYNAKNTKQAMKAQKPVSFTHNKDNLFGTLQYSEEKLANDTFQASQTTLNRVDEDINKILTDGYKQGYGINDVSRSLTDRFDQLRTWESKRIARTEIHTAQNMGIMNSYESLGVEYTQWIAAQDTRTRDSHMEIDGEIIRIGDKFSNGLEFPGDKSGPIEEWINCRCSNAPYVMPSGMTAPEGMEQFRESDLVPIGQEQTTTPEPQSIETPFDPINQFQLTTEELTRFNELQSKSKLKFKEKREYRKLEEQYEMDQLHQKLVKQGKLNNTDANTYLKKYNSDFIQEKFNLTKLENTYKLEGKQAPEPVKIKTPSKTMETEMEVEIPYAPETKTINGKTYKNFSKNTDEIMDKQIKLQVETKYTKTDLDVVNNWGYEGHLDISAKCFNVPELKTGLKTDAEIETDIKNLGKAIDKSPRLQENATIFRGGEVPDGLKPGDEFVVDGFQSYSFDEDVARGFKEENEKRFLITSHAEKGSKGVHIDDRVFEGLSEDEWLTQKGQKHRVIHVDYEKQILETELVNDW